MRERQAALSERLGRLRSIYGNLDERLRLLASLHWSLPRPMSGAEQELSRQMEVGVVRSVGQESRQDGGKPSSVQAETAAAVHRGCGGCLAGGGSVACVRGRQAGGIRRCWADMQHL